MSGPRDLTTDAPQGAEDRPRLRPLLQPTEHGGWGFVGEPLVAAAFVAQPALVSLLGLAAVLAFLARHPAKLAATDLLRGRRTRRTHWALAMATAEALAAGLLLAGAVALGGTALLWPLGVAGLLAGVQFYFDAHQRGRELSPELVGALAPGAVAAAAALGAGLPATAGWLWLLLGLRALASVLYVRTRLRRLRGVHASAVPLSAAHGALLLALLAAWGTGVAHAPLALAVVFGLLVVRAAKGLLRPRPVRPQQVGIAELVYGLSSAAVFGWALRA